MKRHDLRSGLAGGLLVVSIMLGCSTLSVEREREIGRQQEEQARREFDFFRDRVTNDYIAAIGKRLLDALPPQPFDYEFQVVDSDEINAFAMPAGRIYIHTELILRARNLSELAGVMAHEIGHVAERHIAENYNRARGTGIARQAAVLGAGVLAGQAGALGADLLTGVSAAAYLNSFTRDAEREADAFAVELLPKAGIDPRGIATFFETLRAERGARGGPQFLSSHPATEERIANTRAIIAAQPAQSGLRYEDGGRLEIIQRRIRLLTGREEGAGNGNYEWGRRTRPGSTSEER